MRVEPQGPQGAGVADAPVRFVRSVAALLGTWSPRHPVSRPEFGWMVLFLVGLQAATLLLASSVHHLLNAMHVGSQWQVVDAIELLLAVLLVKAVVGRYVDAGVPIRVLFAQVLVLALALWLLYRAVAAALNDLSQTFSFEQSTPTTNDRGTIALGLVGIAIGLADVLWVLVETGRPTKLVEPVPTREP